MINQMDSLDWNNVFNPYINVFVIIFFIALMLIAFYKMRIFLIVLTIFLFSIVIGIMSIAVSETPFTPYIQIFFILFQSIMFIKFTLDVYI